MSKPFKIAIRKSRDPLYSFSKAKSTALANAFPFKSKEEGERSSQSVLEGGNNRLRL